MEFATSKTRGKLIPDQPVLALTLQLKASGRAATRSPVPIRYDFTWNIGERSPNSRIQCGRCTTRPSRVVNRQINGQQATATHTWHLTDATAVCVCNYQRYCDPGSASLTRHAARAIRYMGTPHPPPHHRRLYPCL